MPNSSHRKRLEKLELALAPKCPHCEATLCCPHCHPHHTFLPQGVNLNPALLIELNAAIEARIAAQQQEAMEAMTHEPILQQPLTEKGGLRSEPPPDREAEAARMMKEMGL